jgi:hypothetical protein
MARKLLSIVAIWLAVQESTAAFAFSKHTDAVTDASVRRLLRLMDKDKNGTVSKSEFMNYFSERFDTLDVDRNRHLEPDEMRPMIIPNWVLRPKSKQKPHVTHAVIWVARRHRRCQNRGLAHSSGEKAT